MKQSPHTVLVGFHQKHLSTEGKGQPIVAFSGCVQGATNEPHPLNPFLVSETIPDMPSNISPNVSSAAYTIHLQAGSADPMDPWLTSRM